MSGWVGGWVGGGVVVGGRVREWQWQQVVVLYGPACSHSSLWAGWVGGWRVWRGGGGW